MNFGLKQKIFFTNIGIVAALLLIAGTIIYPTAKNILELRGEINAVQLQLEERYEKTKKLKRSLKELEQIKVITAEFKKTFARPKDELVIITTMEKLATDYQIDQTFNLNFIDEAKQKTADSDDNKKTRSLPKYYRLSFLNNGLFANQLSYLSALQKLPYYVIIENLNFEKKNQGEKKELTPITSRFDAIIYVEAN